MTDKELMQQALDALSCSGDADDPGHRCSHCDDYVDRNGPLRTALRERLEQPQQQEHPWEHHAKKLTYWLYCMSYNDSYFGEPEGLVKQVTSELNRLIGKPPLSAEKE